MTPSKMDTVTDDLAFFTRFPEPRRSSVMVAIADPRPGWSWLDHWERLGYEVWTARSGLDAYRACLTYTRVRTCWCATRTFDLPPLVLYSRLKTHLPGLQCCVLASFTHRIRSRVRAEGIGRTGRGRLAGGDADRERHCER